MRKIKWQLLMIAFAGLTLAFVNSKNPTMSLHRYAYSTRSMDGTRFYVSKDLTAAGWQRGIDYDCINTVIVCTFLADPTKEHADFVGNYFLYSDIPSSGIDSTGTFTDL